MSSGWALTTSARRSSLRALPVHVRPLWQRNRDALFGMRLGVPHGGNNVRSFHQPEYVRRNHGRRRKDHRPIRLGSHQIAPIRAPPDPREVHPPTFVQLDQDVFGGGLHGSEPNRLLGPEALSPLRVSGLQPGWGYGRRMALRYDPPAAAAVHALLADPTRSAVAERVVAALWDLDANSTEARFRRRSYAGFEEGVWGFQVRARSDALLILWRQGPGEEEITIRYVGPDFH